MPSDMLLLCMLGGVHYYDILNEKLRIGATVKVHRSVPFHFSRIRNVIFSCYIITSTMPNVRFLLCFACCVCFSFCKNIFM